MHLKIIDVGLNNQYWWGCSHKDDLYYTMVAWLEG